MFYRDEVEARRRIVSALKHALPIFGISTGNEMQDLDMIMTRLSEARMKAFQAALIVEEAEKTIDEWCGQQQFGREFWLACWLAAAHATMLDGGIDRAFLRGDGLKDEPKGLADWYGSNFWSEDQES